MNKKKPIVYSLEFIKPTISKVVFTDSREEAQRLEKNGMHIYFPSELAKFDTGNLIYVLLDG